MTAPDRRNLERRAAILKSLAHPSRLLIIEMLEKGPRCVGELTEAVGADITTVSKHLAVMRRSGLVRAQRRGTYMEYSLVCDCVTRMIDCIEEGTGSRSGREPSGAARQKPPKSCKAVR